MRVQVVMLPKGDQGPLRTVAQDMGLALLEVDTDASLPAGQFRLDRIRSPASGRIVTHKRMMLL